MNAVSMLVLVLAVACSVVLPATVVLTRTETDTEGDEVTVPTPRELARFRHPSTEAGAEFIGLTSGTKADVPQVVICGQRRDNGENAGGVL